MCQRRSWMHLDVVTLALGRLRHAVSARDPPPVRPLCGSREHPVNSSLGVDGHASSA